MLVSVCTPTNNPEWLLEAYHSLKAQTHQDYEWLLLPNGPARGTLAIPEVIRSDPHWPRILPYTPADGIGCLKKMCHLQARGELLVELDHDDYLAPTALETLVATYQRTKADFLYSDCVHFFPDHQSEIFSPTSGWRHYPFAWQGHDYTVMQTFEPSARSLCEIYWAPNHVRCWSREAYLALGGHSGRLAIADDHDLLCRTYLAGYQFAHIPQPLYFYRRHPLNNFLLNNDAVQAQQRLNCARYLHELVFEECRRNKWPMIDLGGAHNSPKDKGFISLDTHDAEIICDVCRPLPFADNSVGCFRACDFLEHIPIAEVVGVMNQLYRKLVPGGWLLTSTPSVSDDDGRVGRGAFQDPSHQSFWSQNNIWYFTDKTYSRYVPEIQCRFQSVRCHTWYPSDWHRHQHIPYLLADLYALKGQHAPGQQLI